MRLERAALWIQSDRFGEEESLLSPVQAPKGEINGGNSGATVKGVSWTGHRTRCYGKAVLGEGREEQETPERFPNLLLQGEAHRQRPELPRSRAGGV